MNNIKSRKKHFSGKNTSSSEVSRKRGNQRSNNNRNRKKVSTLDPALLINKAKNIMEEVYTPTVSFDDMPIDPRLKSNILAKGFQNPTQIQVDSIRPLIEGRDLVGIAKTGTGKTAAFLIPVIQHLIMEPKLNYSLIVVPTRELALQVEEEFKSLSRGMSLFSSSFIGGTNVNADISKLKRRNHIIIGTPGRLIDMMQRKALPIDQINTLILDEFDRMLDMGFVNDIRKMVDRMDNRKQTILFSATKDPSQQSLIGNLLYNPVEVQITATISGNEMIDQDIIKVSAGEDKFGLLMHLLSSEDAGKVLIFAETKRAVDKLNKKLNREGVTSDQIHGNKTQNYRSRALGKFKKGNVKVLVATDVAARGIDVDNISHVINYQIPMTFENYVHRIGRTGRAGKTGKAITFID